MSTDNPSSNSSSPHFNDNKTPDTITMSPLSRTQDISEGDLVSNNVANSNILLRRLSLPHLHQSSSNTIINPNQPTEEEKDTYTTSQMGSSRSLHSSTASTLSDDTAATTNTSTSSKPRLGDSYQAELLEDSESSSDIDMSGTLVWDPEAYNNAEEDLLKIWEIPLHLFISSSSSLSSSNFISHGVSSSSSSSSICTDSDYGTTPVTPSSPCDSEVEPDDQVHSTPEPSSSNLRIISLDEMMDIINRCHYSQELIKTELDILSIRGWSPHFHQLAKFSHWTESEKERFDIAMTYHPKDFPKIQSLVSTKTTEECVDYYYGWKHSKRYHHWLAQHALYHSTNNNQSNDPGEEVLVDDDESNAPAALESRALPSSKKRKREHHQLASFGWDHPEMLYLETTGSFARPEFLFNLTLDAPPVIESPLLLDNDTPHQNNNDTIIELTHNPDLNSSVQMLQASASFSRNSLAAMSPKRPKLVEHQHDILLHKSNEIHSETRSTHANNSNQHHDSIINTSELLNPQPHQGQSDSSVLEFLQF